MTKKKKKKKIECAYTCEPHIFSGWKGLLEQERGEAEGECGGGGRKEEEGGGIAMHLLATVILRTCTVCFIQQQNHLCMPLCLRILSTEWKVPIFLPW